MLTKNNGAQWLKDLIRKLFDAPIQHIFEWIVWTAKLQLKKYIDGQCNIGFDLKMKIDH